MVITPLVFNSFLSNVESDAHDDQCLSSENETAVDIVNATSNQKPFGELHTSEIWIPHLVIGIFMVINGILCIILELQRLNVEKNETDKKNECEEENVSLKQTHVEKSHENKVQAQHSKLYRVSFVTVMCILIATYWGFASSFVQFWITFVMFLDMNISKNRAVMMLSAFSFAAVVGNFIAMLIATKVKSMPMLIAVNILTIVSVVICIFGANGSETLLWVGCIMCSLCSSNYYSSAYNLLEEKVGVTNLIGSLYAIAAASLNAIGLPILIANFIECSPSIFLYFTTISISVVFLLLLVLFVLSYGKEDLRQETKDESDEIKEKSSEVYIRKYSMRRVSVGGIAL
ncbi:Sodium-dependent glucose transporter-like protein 1 [Leptotrombidium deliense]|uniref:Sodium-dependent glucose transporter-like protein 1 n=1 Tax=Leptotrombidium deliense TaxID=299467 RepID=A0A443S9Q1_9ACAR|nr:Sodium-dependent glucose transporter-like protein 1 [Leptotrombidium deliense]